MSTEVEVFEAEVIEGEIVDNLLGLAPGDMFKYVELSPSTVDEARARSERIKAGLVLYVHTREAIAEAWARRDWKVLGYDNWDAYLKGEFGDELRRLTGDERREAVEEFRRAGMPTRAIASAVGAGQSTVRDDLAQLSGSTQLPKKVKGLDGKDRPAKREPKPPKVDSAAREAAQALIDQRVASGELIRLVDGAVIDAASFDPAVHTRAADRPNPAPAAQPGPKAAEPAAKQPRPEDQPGYWSPEERKAHEAEVRRKQEIASAHRAAKNIVTEFRSLVVTVVSGCRYGEKGLVTRQMVADLREVLDLLEGEIDDAQ